MKQIFYRKYGSTDSIELGSSDEPSVSTGTMIVRNYASSVNPIDWKIRAGQLRPLSGLLSPGAAGCDFAGEVEVVAPGVTQFKPGDRVYGFLFPLKGGAYAEHVAVPVGCAALIPPNLNFEEAGVVPLSGLTAYDALTRVTQLKEGHRVIINGCSGGVGTMALQIAKILGAYVIGVCSKKNHSLAMELGADEVIDYHENPTLSGTSPVDILFDVVGSQPLSISSPLLKEDGIHVHTLPELKTFVIDPLMNVLSKKKTRPVIVKPNGQSLDNLSKWIEAGLLKPHIGASFSLENMREAQALSETGRAVGKISIQID